jgi:hypothetical protein
MSFKVQGTELEGQPLYLLIPGVISGSDSNTRYRLSQVGKHIQAGNRVFVEITKGARQGTIGELVFDTTDFDELYGPMIRTGLGDRRYCLKDELTLRFDDRDNTIKIGKGRWKEFDAKNMVLRFSAPGTLWVYTTKPKPVVPKVTIYDHFGVELEVGQVVLFMYGQKNDYSNRFGKIARISDRGTIWVDMFRTREHHKAGQVSNGVYGSNIFVLNGDLREKAMMARLTLE